MKKKKILIIEDDATLLLAYATKLEIEGFEVLTATDGKQGIRQAIKHTPDIILLDLVMPRMSGQEFLLAYDVRDKHPGCRVIVFTNLSNSKSEKECRELGAVKFLMKASFTPAEMVEVAKKG